MLKDVVIRLRLKEVRLGDAIDAICKVAEWPLHYSVEDYAVVFTAGAEQSPPLFTRTFRVDPNTFLEGVKNLTGSPLPAAGGSFDPDAGHTGGIGDPGQANDGLGQSGSGIGISGITHSPSSNTTALLRRFFIAAGVDFSSKVITVGATGMPQPSDKALFFNDRTGLLLVRATTEELDAVEKAVQVLNTSPPQVSIVSRLVEQGESDRVIASPAGTTLSGRQIRTEIPSAGLRLDVLPNVMGDGWSIQLTVDFTLADVSERQDRVTTGSPTPQRSNEPRAPLRVSTRAIIWDGQTMELGPFPTSDGNSERKVLLLITPTIIDPAGNRVHSGD